MKGTFTFIGNATALISFGDITLLTDPNFLHAGQYAYLGHGLVSKRLREPAMDIDELPRVDAVLLSHMHGDHWDRRTEAHLDPGTPIITTAHATKRLQRRGFGAAEALSTWGSTVVQRGNTTATVTAMPGRHGPTWTQTLRLVPPVMGSMIEFEHTTSGNEADRLRIYVSGDTLYVDDLAEIPYRYPSIDTGVFHLGGTTLPFGQSPKRGLMVTMDAVQGAQAVELIDAKRSIPIHFDDYGVFASSLTEFEDETHRQGLADRITYVRRGETVAIGADSSHDGGPFI
ncbi:MAG: MBL fold metallo-hydrolase [Rhodococcus sp.]|nr:MBL fold metallo-hydrolase [Rhodococcus sp. (in: high G+C Gram-positive bacteria)]MBJ7324219.1 MBL fold metallo-hydrolase [Rhodococcus sp. (in: high G+C Gram-positive bacteria)]